MNNTRNAAEKENREKCFRKFSDMFANERIKVCFFFLFLLLFVYFAPFFSLLLLFFRSTFIPELHIGFWYDYRIINGKCKLNLPLATTFANGWVHISQLYEVF